MSADWDEYEKKQHKKMMGELRKFVEDSADFADELKGRIAGKLTKPGRPVEKVMKPGAKFIAAISLRAAAAFSAPSAKCTDTSRQNPRAMDRTPIEDTARQPPRPQQRKPPRCDRVRIEVYDKWLSDR